MAVLLIGSTGMGKSTFGNFLFNPDNQNMHDNPIFPPGTDGRPKTQEVKVASKKVQIEGHGKVALTLIDTPGLNESADRDLSHMIDIIKKVKECGEIRACILVVKFNAKIDAQYKATMKYYSKLLPGLFEKNVIIILTDFATDERSEKVRERQCIDVEQTKRDTISELCNCSNNQIKYTPQVFTIDCLPMGSDEMKASKNERTAILDYILQLPPIRVKNLMVAKTDYIKHKDAEKYEQLQGEIKGYSERLIEVHTLSKRALEDTRHKTGEINEIESKINDLKKQLEEKDTIDEVVAEHLSINKKWRFFQWLTETVHIETSYEITSYTKWTNGRCEFKALVQTPHAIKGKIEGEFMRGIYASVTAYTQKRIKNADEIENLKTKIETKKKNLTECKEEWERYRAAHEENLAEIQLLEKFIAERRIAAQKCRSDLMTMEDATIKLEELQTERFDH